MRVVRCAFAVSLGIAALIPAAAAGATDGVVEINQARALAGGVTPGDAASFPVTLSLPGSYRLTGNLTVASVGTTAIAVAAAGVTLDLNGFRIQGPVVCSGEPATCGAAGAGIGVSAGSTSRTVVRNGMVQGMGGAGIAVGPASRVEEVHALWNGGIGIAVGRLSQVTGCIAEANGDVGVSGGEQVIVDRSTSFANVSSGFMLDAGSIVRGSSALSNGFTGIDFQGVGGSKVGLIEGNSLRGNAGVAVVSLARAAGGNSCDDGSCSPRGARRFYLSPNQPYGANAKSACIAGFHMASLYEVRDTAALEYAPTFGLTLGDSGAGPPSGRDGWIRTGAEASVSPQVGVGNCNAWTSGAPTDYGGMAQLVSPWGTTSSNVTEHWLVLTEYCSVPHSVWCIED